MYVKYRTGKEIIVPIRPCLCIVWVSLLSVFIMWLINKYYTVLAFRVEFIFFSTFINSKSEGVGLIMHI